MLLNFVTQTELESIKNEILNAIGDKNKFPSKRLLKSSEVRKVLGGISAAKLQSLRISGKLPAIDADGMWLYDFEDVKEFIDSNKTSRKEVSHV